MSRFVHSDRLIEMLEVALGLDLHDCYKVVVTAELHQPLSVDISLWGNEKVVDSVKELAPSLVVNVTTDE